MSDAFELLPERAMRTNTFLCLPREIRDQIYGCVLRSPTGYVQYVVKGSPLLQFIPWLYRGAVPKNLQSGGTGFVCRRASNLYRFSIIGIGEPYIDLSLFRTCRQIYEEAKDQVWKQNTFAFLGDEYSQEVKRRLGQRLAHVWTRSDFGIVHAYNNPSTVNVQLLSGTLELFRQWAVREGQLETVTVVVAEGKHPVLELLAMASDMPVFFEECLAVLRDDCGKWKALQLASDSGARSQGQKQRTSKKRYVARRLELEIELGKGDDRIELPPHTLRVLEALHNAYGGEFWINKRLCFKDGKMASVPFEV